MSLEQNNYHPGKQETRHSSSSRQDLNLDARSDAGKAILDGKFEELSDFLKVIMIEEYAAVNRNTNPVARLNVAADVEATKEILGQYSWLSKSICGFMIDTCYSAQLAGWDKVVEELTQNIKEELEEGNSELSHFSEFRQSLEASLHMNLGSSTQSEGTSAFLTSVRNTLQNADPAIVLGAAYAIEATSIPELEIMWDKVQELYKAIDVEIPARLRRYFESHIGDIEIIHLERMQVVFAECTNNSNEKLSFISGFRSVMASMDEWWDSMAKGA